MTDLVEQVAAHLAARNGGVWAVFSHFRKEKYRKTARAIIPLVEADMRERCAKVAEAGPYTKGGLVCGCSEGLANHIAASIRNLPIGGDDERG